MMPFRILLVFTLAIALPATAARQGEGVRLKELARLSSAQENSLVGYGLVTGLAGTGDSSRSAATLQSLSNTLQRFGVNVPPQQIHSRNAAAVMLTATLPPFTQPGDKLDVNVTSIGDARSLLGGTLVLSDLTGPDGEIYALVQGPVSIGGFRYDLNGNLVQKNHTTTGQIPGGAVVQHSIGSRLLDKNGTLEYVLFDPDFTTAGRIADSINRQFGKELAKAVTASRVRVTLPEEQRTSPVDFIIQAENITVDPDRRAVVVVNERTGTVVSGGDVRLSRVSVTQGDLKVSIRTQYAVSQPQFVIDTGTDVRTEVVPQTTINVMEQEPLTVALPDDTSVVDLVAALNKVKASSRDIITILQAIKRSGALHAELVIQ